jgi:hypothetical protein
MLFYTMSAANNDDPSPEATLLMLAEDGEVAVLDQADVNCTVLELSPQLRR